MTIPVALHLTVRIPSDLRNRLRTSATTNRRSMNSEIIHHLDCALEAQKTKGAAGSAIPPRHDHTQTDEGTGNE
ncbi:Arc family DNA-binding protein [Devosia sp.]|uniref:Arc family DNA-binding protein n=1 Tax=Devosia sp. TaxID=1871048 RepID=UPI003525A055